MNYLIRLLSLLALVAALTLSGIAQHFTDKAYRWLGHATVQTNQPSPVLLINVNGDALAADQDYWLKLIRAINVHQPRHITLAVQPTNVDQAFYQELSLNAPAIIAAKPIVNTQGKISPGSHIPQLNALPLGWLFPLVSNKDGTLAYNTSVGKSNIVPGPNSGVNKAGLQSAEVLAVQMGLSAKTINNQAGDTSADNKVPVFPQHFRVRASNAEGILPQVNADDLIKSGLEKDQVSGRWVFIGQNTLTPRSLYSDGLTAANSLQRRGHVLAALIQNSWLRALPTWSNWLIIVSLIAAWYSLFTRTAQYLQRWLIFAWVLVTIIGLIAMFRWLHLLLPLTEVLSIPFLAMLVEKGHRQLGEKAAFNQVLEMTEPRMAKQRELSDFYLSDDYWDKILTLIRQTLQLEATIILECPTGKPHLDIVAKYGCSEALVYEKRRDYRRAPYDTALKYGKPIQPERPFFDIDSPQQVQYICPLRHRGETLGFWALNLRRETMLDIPFFEDVLQKYSRQISALLYQRQHMNRGKAGLLPMEIQDEHLSVDKSRVLQRVAALESQLRNRDNLINAMKTGYLLYDLFGDLVSANTAAKAFANSNKLAIFEGNALDLIVTLTGCSPNEGRETLLDIIVHNSDAILPVTIEKSKATHVIQVRLVQNHKEYPQTDMAPRPFGAQGILFEIVDYSRIARLHREKETLLVNLTTSAADMLGGTHLAIRSVKRLLRTKKQSTDNIDKLEDAFNEINTVMTSLSKQLYLSEDIIRNGHLYVDMKVAVENSLARYGHELVVRMIEVIADLSDYCELAKTDTSDLERALDRTWAVMLETANEHSQLHILLDQEEVNHKNIVRCIFINQGHGLPKETIDAFNCRDLEKLSPSLGALRLMVDDIIGKGGTLMLRSSPDSVTVILALEAFSEAA